MAMDGAWYRQSLRSLLLTPLVFSLFALIQGLTPHGHVFLDIFHTLQTSTPFEVFYQVFESTDDLAPFFHTVHL